MRCAASALSIGSTPCPRFLGLGRALVGVHVGDVLGGVAGGEEHSRLAGIEPRGSGRRQLPSSAAAMIASLPERRRRREAVGGGGRAAGLTATRSAEAGLYRAAPGALRPRAGVRAGRTQRASGSDVRGCAGASTRGLPDRQLQALRVHDRRLRLAVLGHALCRFRRVDRLDALGTRFLALGRALVGVDVGATPLPSQTPCAGRGRGRRAGRAGVAIPPQAQFDAARRLTAAAERVESRSTPTAAPLLPPKTAAGGRGDPRPGAPAAPMPSALTPVLSAPTPVPAHGRNARPLTTPCARRGRGQLSSRSTRAWIEVDAARFCASEVCTSHSGTGRRRRHAEHAIDATLDAQEPR